VKIVVAMVFVVVSLVFTFDVSMKIVLGLVDSIIIVVATAAVAAVVVVYCSSCKVWMT